MRGAGRMWRAHRGRCPPPIRASRTISYRSHLRYSYVEPSPASSEPRSIPVDFHHSLGKGPRSFLRQIVPDATRDESVRILAREFLGIGGGIRMWCTVAIAFHRNGRHRDDRSCSKPLFQVVILRLAFGQAYPPAVIVDHDADVIGVVKCRSAAIAR